MQESDLIREIAKQTNISQKDVKKVINSLKQNIQQALKEDDYVILRGLCKFEMQNYSAREIRQIDGLRKVVKEHKTPKCKMIQNYKKKLEVL